MKQVCIVACGARTAVGSDAMASAAAIRSGIQGIREHPYMVDLAGEPYCVGADLSLKEIGRKDRIVALAQSAISEALDCLGQCPIEATVFLSTFEIRQPEGERETSSIAKQLAVGLRGYGNINVVAIPRGNAGGFLALRSAVAQIKGGASFCIVAGADSLVDSEVLDDLDAESRLLCARHRWGIPPGEAGAAVVLTARSNGRRNLGEILSVAIGEEPRHRTADDPCTGVGLGAVITDALKASNSTAIENTLCDLDGDRYRDREYTWATQRFPNRPTLDPSAFTSLVSECGAVGGATAVLALSMSAAWARRGHFSDTDVLLWAGSNECLRGAAVIRTGSDLGYGRGL